MRVRALVAGLTGALCAASAILHPFVADARPTVPDTAASTTTLIVHTARTAHRIDSELARADGSATVRRQLVRGSTVAVRVPTAELDAQRVRLAALPGVTSVEPPVTRRLLDLTPDDPYLPRESRYLDAVHAPAAWTRQRGSSAVTIAVVDSGIDVTHPDLRAKIAGTYDAVTPSSPAITDTLGHGTFVAGVAAADTDNGTGVAGAGFDTRLLGVKVAGATDEISIDDEVAGIRWAADHGADIVNLSIGGADYSRSEADAVAYAQRRGALVVAAAGNGADDTPQYPAAYPGVVAVGAVDTVAGTRADFSSYGRWVTLAAPGVDLYATTPTAGSQFFPPGGYGTASGTSFAAPLVSGEAALLLAQNPTSTPADLRAALVRSAHGYGHLGLGAGLVDFARALDHVRPTTVPVVPAPTVAHDRIAARATSTAPAVAFAVDGGPRLAPVAVHGGVAAATLATGGYADGPHTLSAVDCTPYGECGRQAGTATLDLTSPVATITSPRGGAALTGRVVVSARRADGGTLRLLVDGVQRGLDHSAPYAFSLDTSALHDGTHTLTVQQCSTDGSRCAGPLPPATTITSAALHPAVDPARPARISPDGDRVLDSASVGFRLPDAEAATAEVLDASGAVVARYPLGTLGAGHHAWTWRGVDSAGRRLPDGPYTLAVSTSRGALRGWASTTGTVDTLAPSIEVTAPRVTRFYPSPDGYRDRFTPVVTLAAAAAVQLEVTDARGRTVRRITHRLAAGRTAFAWDGTDTQGHRVAAGRYRYRFSVTDDAGNTHRASAATVLVSAKRLVARTVTVTAPAAHNDGAGGSAACARVSPRSSAYRHGALFSNSCPTDDYDIAFAHYVFTLPEAVRYGDIAFAADGRAGARRAQLTAAFDRVDGVIEVPAYLTVAPGPARLHTIAHVSGVDHVDTRRRVRATLVLTGEYGGTNTFDASTVRLRVGVVVLR